MTTTPLDARLAEVEEFLDVWDAAPAHRTRYRDVISSQKSGDPEGGRKLRATALRDLVAEAKQLHADLAEMTRCRDNAVRAIDRMDVAIEFHLDEALADGLVGIAEWNEPEPDHAPKWLIDAVVRVVRPELARLTEQRDQLSAEVDGFHVTLADNRLAHTLAAVRMIATECATDDAGLLRQAILDCLPPLADPQPGPAADAPLTVTVAHNGADKQLPHYPADSVADLAAAACHAFGLGEHERARCGLFTDGGVELDPGALLRYVGIEPGDLLVLRPRIVRT